MPNFQYLLPGECRPVSETSPIWDTPLPADRHWGETSPTGPHPVHPTYGDLFTAARTFFESDQFHLLAKAVSSQEARHISPSEIWQIDISLIKHGAFYHPALVTLHHAEDELKFVLNTAVSESGLNFMAQEFASLKKLNATGAKLYIPTVYGHGKMESKTGLPIQMFLGDWLDGFHEFHLSRDNAGHLRIQVWDDKTGFHFLNENLRYDLYTQIAFILSASYNALTFEHIFPWHHAAGDFVVKLDHSGLQVRLITVRKYDPLYRDVQVTTEKSTHQQQIIMGLLFFLLNLTIRTRIDRLDGTGDLVWGGDEIVHATWKGFLSGLKNNFFPSSLSDNITSSFFDFLSRISVTQLFELALVSAGGFNEQAPEISLIEKHLIDHTAILWTIISQSKPG